MRRVASSLVFFAFLCYVQCQWNNVLESDADLDVFNQETLKTDQGWSLHRDRRSVQFRPTVSKISLLFGSSQSNGRRTRRQLFPSHTKHSNAVEDPYNWMHTFTMEWTSPTKDSTYIYNESTKRLKHLLEKNTDFQFLNPTCLRISIPADSINVLIEEIRVKLNEAFRDNDPGHFSPINERNGGRWNFYIPNMRVKQGDKVYYRAKVKFIKEGLDATVKGLLEITMGNPHSGGVPTESMPFCSRAAASVIRPQTYPSELSSRIGDDQGAFAWSHQFNVDLKPGEVNKDSTKSWVAYSNLLKNILEKDNVFKFLSPTGLTFSIPESNINWRIVDFRVKVNEEFRELDGGHFAPGIDRRDGQSRFYIPNLKVTQGDRVFYRMQVKLGKEGIDATVNGVVDITVGDPHVNPQPVYNPHISQVVDSYTPPGGGLGGTYTPPGDGLGGIKVTQGFSWNHKFISKVLNSTKGGFSQETADRWLEREDTTFKEDDIDFQFLNPTGLNILISGDNKEVLDFQVKLNEDFKTFVPGQYWPKKTRTSDGKYSYIYQGLKLKPGDKLYYWMRVVVGKELWDYNVKGILEISKGNPHIGSNSPGAVSAPTPTWPKAPIPTLTQVVHPYPSGVGNNGKEGFSWEHRFKIDLPVNRNFTEATVEDAERLKKTLEKDIDFQFSNPTGLRITIPDEDKGFRILAFNIKVNENFENLESGDFLANITRMGNGRWSHYYPNVRVKQGDRVYYWMRVTFGKQLTDTIVRGELEIKYGNPHKGGPIAEPSPPNLVTPTRPPFTQSVTPQNNYQTTNQVPNIQPVNPQIHEQPTNVELQTQTPIAINRNEVPNQVLPLQIPVVQNNQPSDQSILTQSSVVNPAHQNCADPNGDSSLCDKKVIKIDPKDGQPTHLTVLGPVYIVGLPVAGNKDLPENTSNKS